MNRKLTDEQIRFVRSIGQQRAALPTDRELADRYGVTVRAIRYHMDNRSKPSKSHVSRSTILDEAEVEILARLKDKPENPDNAERI